MNYISYSFCKIFFALFLVINTINVSGQSSRKKENFNSNWQYSENTTHAISQILKEEKWEEKELPHTWNSHDVTDQDPGYRRNASWYRKNLNISEVAQNMSYELYFEGSNITTEVYVNGTKAGEHVGGYVGFTIEITPFLKKGDNDILVRVNNSYNPEIIPSQKSDFFIYGGIVRDVWLVTKPKEHIDKVIARIPTVSKKEAMLWVEVDLDQKGTYKKHEVKAVLKNPNGKIVSSSETKFKENSLKLDFDKITNPELWDIDTPNLYTLEISLLNSGKEIDKVIETIGFRWFEFKKNGPFFLNGKRVLLRGTHRHEEHAGYGAAMPNELHRKDIKAIKEMGANFIRLAHYPQDPEVYKMCDELGILVWDEVPWCRGGLGNEVWQSNTKRLLKEMILQNINHPSIILWSLGNEIYWLPDFEGGDDTEKINVFLKEMNDLAHTLDPSRKTAIRKYYEGSDIVDVFSPSIWSGWYAGSYKTYEKAVDKYIKEYNSFLHAEYGGSSHVGRHTENPIDGEGVMDSDGWTEAITQTAVTNIAKIGDWSENYIVDLFDWHLRVAEQKENFVGNVQWAFKDFGTPLRPENDIPYMNQKGVVDREGKPKDAYYVFKSYWAKDPFVYIESHSWKERQGPKDKERELSVYSNCKEVELFLNGVSLGKKKKDITKFPASGLTWKLNFKEGANKLKAVGYTKEGIKVEDEMGVNYRFKKNDVAKQLELTYDKLDDTTYLVTAVAKDSEGLKCLDYEERVYFQCLGGGETYKSLGTPTGSESIKMANGKASIKVSADSSDEPITIMVLNQSFKGTYLKILK